jgi:hypothetical protein
MQSANCQLASSRFNFHFAIFILRFAIAFVAGTARPVVTIARAPLDCAAQIKKGNPPPMRKIAPDGVGMAR